MMQFLKWSVLLLALQLSSCGDQTPEQSAKESLKEAEEALQAATEKIEDAEDKIREASNVLNKQKMYCCSNHEPAHCGTVPEMEKLIKTTGCSGFEERGVAAD